MDFPDVISRAETVAAGSSPRSEGVATARGDGVCGGEVVALPIPTGAPLDVWRGHRSAVLGALALEDGDGAVLSWSADGDLRVWRFRAPTGADTHANGHERAIVGATFLRDGRALTWSDDGTLRTWRNGQQDSKITGHLGGVLNVWQLTDGSVVSSGKDHTLKLWDIETTRPIARFEGHGHRLRFIDLMPDGRMIGRDVHDLYVWDGATGLEIARCHGHTDEIKGARVLSLDHLLSWSADGTVRIWEMASGRCVACLDGHRKAGSVNGAVLSRQGHLFTWSYDGIRMWDTDSWTQVGRINFHWHVRGLEMLDIGLITWGSREWALWDLSEGRVQEASLPDRLDSIDGARALWTGDVVLWSRDGALLLWTPGQSQPRLHLTSHNYRIIDALQVDDDTLLTWSAEADITAWNTSTGGQKSYWGLDRLREANVETWFDLSAGILPEEFVTMLRNSQATALSLEQNRPACTRGSDALWLEGQ